MNNLTFQVLTNKRGEKARRHWIVFDGDVDPDWAENLNSVLDDNKILTLPSGERLEIPDNVRIMLEVRHQDTSLYESCMTLVACPETDQPGQSIAVLPSVHIVVAEWRSGEMKSTYCYIVGIESFR